MKFINFLRQVFKPRQMRTAVWRDAGFLGGRQYGNGVSKNANDAELLKAYRGWVYACASLIARNVAKVPVRLFLNGGDEIIDHPILQILKRPNPVHTQYELWETTIVWLELTGNAYWYTPRNGLGVPAEIWPVQPDRMQVVPDKNEIIGGYLYEYQGKTIAFDRDEIVHLRYPNPTNIYYGMSPLQAAAYSYDTDLFMSEYSVNLFKNDGRPTGALLTDQVLDQGTIDRIRAAWKQVYGGVDNAGKIAVLQAGTRYERLQINPAELDYLASRRATRDEILGIFGVPASKLGLVEDVNRANAEANNYTFQNEVILPRLRLIQSKLNKELTADFDPRLSLQFDNPVPGDAEQQMREMEARLKNFVTSVTEERERLGLPAAPWGDEPLVPFNLVPISETGFRTSDSSENSGQPNMLWAQGAVEHFAGEQRDIREAEWMRFLAVQAPGERRIQKGLRQLFGQQRQEVLKNLRNAIKSRRKDQKADPALVDFILFSQQVWEKKFADMATPEFLKIFTAGVKKALKDIEAGDFQFDFRHPKVTAFLREKTFKFSFEVNNTTINQLRAELIAGLDAGESLAELTERVNGVFDFADVSRSLRIARTETTSAVNTGIIQAYDQSGVVEKKMWISSRDANVRITHEAADGQTVPVDGKFSLASGETLEYPGDPSASAAEIVNCRCTIIPAK